MAEEVDTTEASLTFRLYEVANIIEGLTSDEQPERFMMVETLPGYELVVSGDDGLLREFVTRVMGPQVSRGPAPASQASIDTLMVVNKQEEENLEEEECVICLEKLFEKGWEAVVKQTPCKHRFHGKCIDKWLSMHGTCPMCRYKMAEEEFLEIGDSVVFWIERDSEIIFNLMEGAN
ncbi:E3 ubiquitin-protein ligase [Rhynchospora pubera]|uniref:E3 ubiquitin-protein ligase n=1 Tax=Rhynchospora pubera TaxID=906938 RepID=A0AAV8C076_9POAL|nr:E3 ubiquitin-protein ligase [Rhynchospora pubera]